MSRRKLFTFLVLAAVLALPWGSGPAWAQTLTWTQPVPNPAVNYDLPNFAYSPILPKFVDQLVVPGTGTTDIPIAAGVAQPDGSRLYYLALGDYTAWRFHANLPATKLRSYYQTNSTGTAIVGPRSYLGPIIVAQRGVPTRFKFWNRLGPSTTTGKLFLPVDETLMGAGAYSGVVMPWGTVVNGTFTQNRAAIHLHGGNTPWVSDGTPHQWITPVNDPTNYPKGLSFKNVPDMSESVKDVTVYNARDGLSTHYYTNDQSSRLMFYHDHALGLTRLNVYAGEAAGFLLTDNLEEDLITRNILPQGVQKNAQSVVRYGTPLIIQDKTFVNNNNPLPAGYTAAGGDPNYNANFNTTVTDPLWNTASWGGNGSLWFPHVYMPNQLPLDGTLTSVGRWDYGPWFWPPISVQNAMLPTISAVPEAFMDTPIVNGKAYPYINVDRKAYRFRILNACNDRSLNLQLYYANNSGPIGTPGSALYDANLSTYPVLDDVTLGRVTSMPVDAAHGNANSDVIMVPAIGITYNVTLPDGTVTTSRVPRDVRTGGVPDPRQAGPAIIQIGSEGGFLPKPAILNHPPAPIDFDYDPKSATYGFIRNYVGQGYDQVGYTLCMGPAERADVIIDFSSVPAGSTIILYNDAPAAFPLFDRRYDFYTGNPDFSGTASAGGAGGTITTRPGFGPNTRTIMKFVVGSTTGAPVNPNLAAELLAAYKASHTTVDDPQYLVPTPETNAAGLTNDPNPVVVDNRFGVLTGQIPTIGGYPVFLKTIVEDFDPGYGRMFAILGTERTSLDPAGQNAFGYKYVDPVTEDQPDGQTQVWVLIHNGIDTHTLHFHLWNVQVINRLGWDNTVRPIDANELGWKESIRVNALETTIVALRPKSQILPFGLPKSVRPLDVTNPIGTSTEFTNPGPNGLPTTNVVTDFDWEYVWHCHLLGHEENDMMRAVILRVPTQLPSPVTGLAVTAVGGTISWIDPTPAAAVTTPGNQQNEVNFEIQRSTSAGFTTWLATIKAPANATSVADRAPNGGPVPYYYRMRAVNASGNGPWSAVVVK
jgi:FtsP/CotA-like multicopper oxidase with cupredoxin domain